MRENVGDNRINPASKNGHAGGLMITLSPFHVYPFPMAKFRLSAR